MAIAADEREGHEPTNEREEIPRAAAGERRDSRSASATRVTFRPPLPLRGRGLGGGLGSGQCVAERQHASRRAVPLKEAARLGQGAEAAEELGEHVDRHPALIHPCLLHVHLPRHSPADRLVCRRNLAVLEHLDVERRPHGGGGRQLAPDRLEDVDRQRGAAQGEGAKAQPLVVLPEGASVARKLPVAMRVESDKTLQQRLARRGGESSLGARSGTLRRGEPLLERGELR
mmetsp:Transcript_51070/g.165429  ORF Transcript_51070/g.165429 Transcript_51070/m.165429 type:complete len:230 (+) Transcript_51070:1084-1773(+)